MEGTIYLYNKLAATDSTTHLDVWYKTIINNAKWTIKKVETVSGTDVSIGQEFLVLIPFSDKYKPYHEWKQDDNNKNNTFTMSQGDFIFFDDVGDEVTADNIRKVKTQHKGRVCEIRSVEEIPRDRKDKFGVLYQLRVTGV